MHEHGIAGAIWPFVRRLAPAAAKPDGSHRHTTRGQKIRDVKSQAIRICASIVVAAGLAIADASGQMRNSIGNGSDDPADRDLRTYFVTKSPDDQLRLLAQIDAEANAPGTYRNNPRFWRQHQQAVQDARLFLGEYAESQKDYVSARNWYQKAISVTDTSTLMATVKLANLYEHGLGVPRNHTKYEELMASTGAITPDAQAKSKR
jgi:hypothetical protein